MLNRAVLVGRLTKELELKYTQSGTAVASFNLAVNRQFTNQQGEREADFISCVIWRKGAENLANFTHKGSLIGVDGRIQTRNYENQQGNQVYVTEVVVENFSLLESRSQNQNSAQTGNSSFGNHASNTPHGASTNDNQLGSPSGAGNKYSSMAANDPFAGNGQSIDISDADLPF